MALKSHRQIAASTTMLPFHPQKKPYEKTAHTIPLLMSIDETFDIGLDTGTGVDESYKLPFKFTGTINKLTVKLGPSQMTATEKRAIQEKLALATD